jgi:hypothetical protein
MANMVAIKTNYGRKLNEVFNRMAQNRAHTAQLKDKQGYDGIYLKVMTEDCKRYGWKPQTWWVTRIGCNSFGIEVYVQNGQEWTAIEQLTPQQQLRIANAIDWDTLD